MDFLNETLTGWWLNPTPLKNMSSSIEMMTFPIDGKVKYTFQTTNQIKTSKDGEHARFSLPEGI